MQKKLQAIRNQKGFTLLEIIAVLVILGILAAVAVPRYIALQDEARGKSGQSALAEVTGRLSSAYGSLLLKTNGDTNNMTLAQVIAEAGLAAGADQAMGDFNYTLVNNDPVAAITITQVRGVQPLLDNDGDGTYSDPVTTNWQLPHTI